MESFKIDLVYCCSTKRHLGIASPVIGIAVSVNFHLHDFICSGFSSQWKEGNTLKDYLTLPNLVQDGLPLGGTVLLVTKGFLKAIQDQMPHNACALRNFIWDLIQGVISLIQDINWLLYCLSHGTKMHFSTGFALTLMWSTCFKYSCTILSAILMIPRKPVCLLQYFVILVSHQFSKAFSNTLLCCLSTSA